MLIPGYSRSQAYYICLRCNLDVLTSLASRMLKKKKRSGDLSDILIFVPVFILFVSCFPHVFVVQFLTTPGALDP